MDKIYFPNFLKSRLKISILYLAFILGSNSIIAQGKYELNDGWKCAPIAEVKTDGYTLSTDDFPINSWMEAVVPGTVLTSLLHNQKIKDPFLGMNNEGIPDIYKTGPDYYTYWFVKDFKEAPVPSDNQVYLDFRGVNYSCNIYLNGHKLNKSPHKGMFLRFSYNITRFLAKNGKNRLAVLVYPPDFVGNANGGQGGDGTIARNVGLQYTAGWDWIQPVRDRNTGIWDEVSIQKTGPVCILEPHVITQVPGIRLPEGAQKPAILQVSAVLSNPSPALVQGTLKYEIDGKSLDKKISLKPGSIQKLSLPDYIFQNPKLWWPNGYGPQNLYTLKLSFLAKGNKLSDQQILKIGFRQLSSRFNSHTGSRQIEINGQKIFIKGGNWIISDAMLRLSKTRYDAEIRFHRDMNLNLIRIWGGAMVERPEFYEACDEYGLLVFQDLWISGDCNGRWQDPMKKDDQWIRRKYPDDHSLFIRTAEDQIKMVRNHPSLAIWCGGNEITPPEDILTALRDTLLPQLDTTRWFVDYSNSEAMSYNPHLGNGDGPYGIQPLFTFWEHQTFPFNSEVGSIGIGDYESLKRFIPQENLIPPVYNEITKRTKVDSVWDYHKFLGYDSSISQYGSVKNAEDFAKKAQLVNYDQYRGLAEGFTSHIWDWYTGFIIWKTQNPWTALRGQMYDYYLDPNACLYGLQKGNAPFHIMYNPVSGMIMMVNNGFKAERSLMMVVKTYDMKGKERLITQTFVDIGANTSTRYFSIKKTIDELASQEGVFLSLQLLDADKKQITENLYWIADSKGNYSGLQNMEENRLDLKARYLGGNEIELILDNTRNKSLSFFNRVSLVDSDTKTRCLPVFYSDNYLSVLPGELKKIRLEYPPSNRIEKLLVEVSGWNALNQYIPIDHK